MSETMSVQWFPGHMAKTRRIMASNLKLVDIVVELCDARIPQSSRNPEIDKIVGKKAPPDAAEQGGLRRCRRHRTVADLLPQKRDPGHGL